MSEEATVTEYLNTWLDSVHVHFGQLLNSCFEIRCRDYFISSALNTRFLYLPIKKALTAMRFLVTDKIYV